MSKRTKPAKCVVCGKDIEITVFGSLKTCKCDECKGGNIKAATPTTEAKEDTTERHETVYGEKMTGPRIDGKPNKALRNLCCPYHPQHPMDIVGVIKNDHWGDIVSFQCRQKGCYAVVQISEQSKMSGPLRTTACGTSFEQDDLVETLREGKMDDFCEQRGIEQRHTTGL